MAIVDNMLFCKIPAGNYCVGTDEMIGFEVDQEGPAIHVKVDAFKMAAYPVTNRQFAQFVAQTGYQTIAEKLDSSFVFDYFLSEAELANSVVVPGLTWWRAVRGANWQHPLGPSSNIEECLDHPVVHIAYLDAIAYCQWAGVRLPNEIEWEVAAKGGTDYTHYPWGEALTVAGQHYCNIWQGNFPTLNTKEDGFVGTAPVQTYEPNGYGLYQMIGNVWEWCANPARVPLQRIDIPVTKGTNTLPTDLTACYAIKGGSFLCHASYCNRYRIAARNGSVVTATTNHLGFRVVK